MADARRENRRWLALFWAAAAVLLLGPTAYFGALWYRQQSAIESLTRRGYTIRVLNETTDARFGRLLAVSAKSPSIARNRFEFASETQLTPQFADLHAPPSVRPLFSPFPPLRAELKLLEPFDRDADAVDVVGQAIGFTACLNSLHSIAIHSARTGPFLDRTWGIRELEVHHSYDHSESPDSWRTLSLQRLGQSMPRLQALSLSNIHWKKPVIFPEQGFNNLITLTLAQVSTGRLQLSQCRGLKYARIDGDIGELIVSECADLERLEIDWLRLPQSIVIQDLPRLKGLRLSHGRGPKANCMLGGLPELETVALQGHFQAAHLQGLGESPKLKRVYLEVLKLDDAMIDELSKIKSLEELHLSIGLERGDLNKLTALPNLESLKIHFHTHKSHEDPTLEALPATGRIRVKLVKNLDGFGAESPENETDGQPMPTALPAAAATKAAPRVPSTK